MLTNRNKATRFGLIVLFGFIAAIHATPSLAQCTVNEIIERMVSPAEIDAALMPEQPETVFGTEDAPASGETPEFVFRPEIPPTQRQALRRVGQSCSWTSDVSNCTFRRVARMALRGKDAAYIYDRCSD